MKKNISVLLGLSLVAVVALIPSVSVAQSTTTNAQINSISALLQQMQALQSQINALQASQKALKSQIATEFNAFATSLSLGSQGDAVLALQALLAANPDIYPEGLITGYFGKATEKALKRLQKENGLEQVGHVGPKTRAILNQLLKDNPVAFENEDDDEDDDSDNNRQRGKGEGKRLCAKIPPGHTIAPGWLKKNNGVRPIVPECQTLPKGIEKKLDNGWKPGTTTPDTIAPTINNLSSVNVATTTASITWLTNEKATSTLWYSTNTPLNTSSATKLDDNNWKTSHSYNLSGLVTSTTYYYTVKVVDKSNNSSMSTEHSLTTLGN